MEDVDLLLDAVNRLVERIPQAQRRSVTGWRSGSVGDVSARLGYDVRDLRMMGYSDKQIQSVLNGECTLEELLKRPPVVGQE